ncbi:anti-sigma regulatory factor [Actinoplanes sp. OR16]|uniref:sensor histidine kinase n=1 Tax=Actinoplanes sp. OR16 TaxID=946334 RepID=UPI000F6F464F|nr:sensor histidine kinase [Actinoplanes sp. OR16]BBH68819.1 anti-sigma regulatory factor [Actinoplanes sp. OR16]
MRSGAARGYVGHFHEAGFYDSDAEFLGLSVPFIEEGLAAGEAVVIGYDDRKSDLLRSRLSDPASVEFIADRGLYATPARAIATYRRLFEFHVAMGVGQIRIAGDVPHPGDGRQFEGWDRYESAVNTVWQDFPVWGRCLYDITTASAAVIDAVERTHPHLITSAGCRCASERFQEPPEFEELPPPPDPLEAGTPLAELVDRTPAEARRTLIEIGRDRVGDKAVKDLVHGVSEAVGNAVCHGEPPVTVRIWGTARRIVVSVHDRGPGPADPLAGLVPATADPLVPGWGLWLVHQLDIDTTLIRSADGFTVRFRAEAPSSGA